nr:MAG: hypothetical protein DIU66_06785 [Bacillota bacterium]
MRWRAGNKEIPAGAGRGKDFGGKVRDGRADLTGSGKEEWAGLRLGVGLVGLGWFAGVIAGAIKEKGAGLLELKAVCDVDEEKARNFGERFGVDRVFAEPEELMEDPEIDVVAIATPPHLHFELAMRAFEAGKNVFLEKPGSLVPSQMEELIKYSREKNLKATVDYVMRRNPLYFAIKMISDSEIFGGHLFLHLREGLR